MQVLDIIKSINENLDYETIGQLSCVCVIRSGSPLNTFHKVHLHGNVSVASELLSCISELSCKSKDLYIIHYILTIGDI